MITITGPAHDEGDTIRVDGEFVRLAGFNPDGTPKFVYNWSLIRPTTNPSDVNCGPSPHAEHPFIHRGTKR